VHAFRARMAEDAVGEMIDIGGSADRGPPKLAIVFDLGEMLQQQGQGVPRFSSSMSISATTTIASSRADHLAERVTTPR
jgi:hypothetical protein